MAYAKGKAKSTKAKLEVVDDEELEDDEDLEATEADEDEDEDDDDEDDEEEAPPAKKPTAKKAPAKKAASSDTLGVAWLCELIETKTGKTYKPAILRQLLRKMNNAGELGEREAKTRYAFGGEKDPVVVAILKRVKSGEIEKTRTENLEKLKERAAAKKGAKTAGKKVKAKVVVEDDDFEDDEDDD